jgi:hypothetical protein
MRTANLKTEKFAALLEKGRAYHTYDERFDALIFMVVPPDTPTVVHYVDANIGVLYEPVNSEIVGIQIEAFKKAFLPRHAELEKVWRMTEVIPQLADYGELTVTVETQRPAITREILKISQPVIRKTLPNFWVPVPA